MPSLRSTGAAGLLLLLSTCSDEDGESDNLSDCVGVATPAFACSEGVCTGLTQCDSDANCPATDHDYTANGPRCLTSCGKDRLCRTPCLGDGDCPTMTTCNGVADDGTHYCEIGLTRCDPNAGCPCCTSFRPAD